MKALCLLSGGMDSTTLLYKMLEKGYQTEAISFDYGQKHRVELECAREITKRLDIPHKILEINIGQLGGTSLTDPRIKIPEQEENRQIDTVVPFRNLLFIVYSAAYASGKGIKNLFISPVLEDYQTYRDCRREFYDSLEKTLQLGAKEETEIKIQTPFIEKTKADVIKEGMALGVPYELTHTCYKGLRPACGKCDACKERITALKDNQIVDPLEYQIEIDWSGCKPYTLRKKE